MTSVQSRWQKLAGTRTNISKVVHAQNHQIGNECSGIMIRAHCGQRAALWGHYHICTRLLLKNCQNCQFWDAFEEMSTEIVISGTQKGALWEPEAIMTSVPGPTQIRTETCHWHPLLHRKRKTWRRRKNQSFQHRIFVFLPPPLLLLLLHKRICACINTLPSAHTFQPCWAILGDFGPLGTLLVILFRLKEKDVTKHGLSSAHSRCWNAEHTPCSLALIKSFLWSKSLLLQPCSTAHHHEGDFA